MKIEEDTETEMSSVGEAEKGGGPGMGRAGKVKEDFTLMNRHGMTAMQTLNDQ